jgi:hypothetical protein
MTTENNKVTLTNPEFAIDTYNKKVRAGERPRIKGVKRGSTSITQHYDEETGSLVEVRISFFYDYEKGFLKKTKYRAMFALDLKHSDDIFKGKMNDAEFTIRSIRMKKGVRSVESP